MSLLRSGDDVEILVASAVAERAHEIRAKERTALAKEIIYYLAESWR